MRDTLEGGRGGRKWVVLHSIADGMEVQIISASKMIHVRFLQALILPDGVSQWKNFVDKSKGLLLVMW